MIWRNPRLGDVLSSADRLKGTDFKMNDFNMAMLS